MGMFGSLDILSISGDKQEATFRLVSKNENRRTLQVHLSAACFLIQEDTEDGKLCGEQFESFEQVLSAIDGAEAFGNRLCGLVSDQLAAQLAASADLSSRVVDSDDDGHGRAES